MQSNSLQVFDYIQLIIAGLLIILALFVLKKSFEKLNIYFSLTPILFAVTIFLTVIDNFIANPGWISTFTYLLAPLGILLSAWVVKEGDNYLKNSFNIFFLIIYGIYFVFAIVLEMLTLPTEYPLSFILALNHVIIAIPIFMTGLYYLQFMTLIPEQKQKMLFITIGAFIVVLGMLTRAYSYFQFNQESLIGLIILLIGTFTILFSFLFLGKNKS